VHSTLHTLLLALSVPALGIVLTACLQLIPDKKLDDVAAPNRLSAARRIRRSAK
jgi:pectin methylesterase-like acyl-CoA thioesterase